MLLAYAGLPQYASWVAVVFGGLAFAGNAVNGPTVANWGPLFEPPFMVHIPTLVLGIAFVGSHGVQ